MAFGITLLSATFIALPLQHPASRPAIVALARGDWRGEKGVCGADWPAGPAGRLAVAKEIKVAGG